MTLADIEAQNTAAAYDAFWSQTTTHCGVKRLDLYDDISAYLRIVYPQAQPLSIADVGCGPGYLLQHLSNTMTGYRLELVGIDWSQEAIKQGAQIAPSAQFVRSDVQRHALFNVAFDVVLCIQTLEHVRDPRHFMQHLLQASRRHVVITVPDGTKDTYKAHVNFWSKGDLCQLASEYGRVVTCKHIRDGNNLLVHIERQ